MPSIEQRTLPATEREYAAWLGDVERGVIIPLKWILLLLSASYWLWSRNWAPPEPIAFGLFVSFAFLTIGEQYFFARDRITPRQVLPFVFASFLIDGLFMLGLTLVDASDSEGLSDYTALFVLLVLRGFGLFRSQWQNVVGFLIVSTMFVTAAAVQVANVPVSEHLMVQGRLAFLWGMILMAQAFVGLVNRQRHDEMETRERSIRSASLSSLGDLAAGVAHEINNPIGIIKTYADYLMKSTNKEDGLHEDFETIRDEASRCQEIVRRMLDFSNPQIQGFSHLAFDKLVREVAGFVFHEGHEEDVKVQLDIDEKLPLVRGDSVQLKQAVINVSMNARQILGDYRKEQADESFQPTVKIKLGRGTGPRAPLRLSIRDNGPGIDPADAEKIFEPFYTQRSKGTGLGMAITRRIVEAHHGKISIGPHPEGGTEVVIDIPMAGEEEA